LTTAVDGTETPISTTARYAILVTESHRLDDSHHRLGIAAMWTLLLRGSPWGRMQWLCCWQWFF